MLLVTLEPIVDDHVLERVAVAAACDAAPSEVMPGAATCTEWTPALREGFRSFHRGRFGGLAGREAEQGWAIVANGEVVGVVRLQRHDDDTHEVGMWIVASRRGEGLGTAALAELRSQAPALGVHGMLAETTTENVAALTVLRRHGARLAPEGDGVRGHIR